MRRPSARVAEKAFVAEGVKVIDAALDAAAPVESLYVAAEGRELKAVQDIIERALASGARVFDLAPGIMERVSDTVTPQPVSAVVVEMHSSIGDALGAGAEGARLVLVCVDVRDPGNVGAVIRSGAGAGASAVVCCEGTADPFSPKTVRATAGTIFSMPIVTALSPPDAVHALSAAGFRLVATTAHEGTDYATAELSGDVAVILGNEASGLPAEIVSLVDQAVTIPMARSTESLNVAMTATVISYEIARRRRLS